MEKFLQRKRGTLEFREKLRGGGSLSLPLQISVANQQFFEACLYSKNQAKLSF